MLSGLTLVIVDKEFRDQIVQFSNADIAAVKDGYRTEGVGEAREVINQRMASPGASDFFLLEHGQTEKLAGNLQSDAAAHRRLHPSLSRQTQKT